MSKKTISEKADAILRMLGISIEIIIPNRNFFSRKTLISMLDKWDKCGKDEEGGQ